MSCRSDLLGNLFFLVIGIFFACFYVLQIGPIGKPGDLLCTSCLELVSMPCRSDLLGNVTCQTSSILHCSFYALQIGPLGKRLYNCCFTWIPCSFYALQIGPIGKLHLKLSLMCATSSFYVLQIGPMGKQHNAGSIHPFGSFYVLQIGPIGKQLIEKKTGAKFVSMSCRSDQWGNVLDIKEHNGITDVSMSCISDLCGNRSRSDRAQDQQFLCPAYRTY